MKKLTAGIFATLLAVVSVDGAYAAIASQGYVDEKVGTVTTALGNKADKTAIADMLTKTEAGTTYATKESIADMETKSNASATYATKSQVSSLSSEAEKIANRVTTVSDASDNTHYPTAKAVWDVVKAETEGIASTADLSALTTRVTTAEGEIDTLQSDMADKANTADLGDLATKDTVSATEIDADAVTTEKILDANVTKAKLASDIQTSLGKADSALQQADLADYAKTAEVASTYETKENAASTYETKANASATYETKANASATYETKANASATYATKEEIKGMATDANLNLKQDKTDNTLETTNKTVVGAINEVKTRADKGVSDAATAKSAADAAQKAAETAQTTAEARIPKPSGECSNPTAKCVLVSNGTNSFEWEVIARDGEGE